MLVLRTQLRLIITLLFACILFINNLAQATSAEKTVVSFKEEAIGTYLSIYKYAEKGILIPQTKFKESAFSTGTPVLSCLYESTDIRFITPDNWTHAETTNFFSITLENSNPNKYITLDCYTFNDNSSFSENKTHVDRKIVTGTGIKKINFVGKKISLVTIKAVLHSPPFPDEFDLKGVAIHEMSYSLKPPSIEFIDPYPTLLSDGKLLQEKELLANAQARQIEGAVADGVTQVLLRKKVTSEGTVVFTLTGGESSQNGTLAKIDSEDFQNSVEVKAVKTSKGWFAFAKYLAPLDFNRGGDENKKEREISFQTTYTPKLGPNLTSSNNFKIARPPVVLVHGLWSNPTTWEKFNLNKDIFTIYLADYGATNSAHFQINTASLRFDIFCALEAARARNLAATQVDIVGHSMGGILSRLLTQMYHYKANGNFNKGRLHKIITLNTPHSGAALANLLTRMSIKQGALIDLSQGSLALANLKKTTVPSHAILGLGGEKAIMAGAIASFAIHPAAIFIFPVYEKAIFRGLDHDFVVDSVSQSGGLDTSSTTSFFTLESVHTQATQSMDYVNKVTLLLNAKTNSIVFNNFPAYSTTKTSFVLKSRETLPQFEEGLYISGIDKNQSVRAGSSFSVKVTNLSSYNITDITLVTSSTKQKKISAPYVFNIPISSTTSDNKSQIMAFGTTQDGIIVCSKPVTVDILPPTQASLRNLEFLQDEIYISGINQSHQIYILGEYNDGVKRNISSSKTGTKYNSINPKIAKVSPEGVVTSISSGTTVITAKNNYKTSFATVTVQKKSPLINSKANHLPAILQLLLD